MENNLQEVLYNLCLNKGTADDNMHARYGKTNKQQPGVSESVVGSDGSAAVDNHLDFGALAPLSSLDAVCFFAL